MCTLKFHTKPPRPGNVDYQGHATHEVKYGERLPKDQQAGISAVNKAMFQLLHELDKLGYDMTTAKFSIKTK
jgi:hypothetical protein